MNFFKLSLNVLYQALFQQKTIKKIGHHSCLRDVMGQSYTVHAHTHANHMRYSWSMLYFAVAQSIVY